MLFSFFKRNKSNIQVPNWANFFTQKEYDRFLKLLDSYLVKRNISYTYGNGVIHIDEEHFGAEKLGLLNLAQICKHSKQVRWRKVIAAHFDELRQASIFQNEFDKNIHDFSYVSPYIGVRLYHNNYMSHIEDGLTIGHQLTEDIFALLVFDFPHSIVNVRPEQTIQWNKYNEELFDIGLSNIRSKYNFNTSEQKIGDITIHTLEDRHFFVPNVAFDLRNRPDLLGSKGSLIGIPNRHCIIIYPIENLEVITAINQIIPIIYRLEEQGPGSISANIFWFQDDEFITLPYKLAEEKLEFYPPEKFADLLNTLDAA